MSEIDLKGISEMTEKELVANLNVGSLSLANKIDSSKVSLLKQKVLGLVCGHFLGKIVRRAKTQSQSSLRRQAVKLIRKYAPYREFSEKVFYPEETSVIGFNHPSFGEIVRLVGVCFEQAPAKRILFPVNVVWFEALVRYNAILKEMGIEIVPLITPSIMERAKQKLQNSQEMGYLAKIKWILERYYGEQCRKIADEDGIIVTAPSATRQATIFPTREAYITGEGLLPVVSLLAINTLRTESKFRFIPVFVLPPRFGFRGIGVFRKYELHFCQSFSREEIEAMRKNRTIRKFDYWFLEQIGDMSWRVCGPSNSYLCP